MHPILVEVVAIVNPLIFGCALCWHVVEVVRVTDWQRSLHADLSELGNVITRSIRLYAMGIFPAVVAAIPSAQDDRACWVCGARHIAPWLVKGIPAIGKRAVAILVVVGVDYDPAPGSVQVRRSRGVRLAGEGRSANQRVWVAALPAS